MMTEDKINPSHYQKPGRRESIDEIRETLGDTGFEAFCLGNALKYLYRAGLKEGEDKRVCWAKADWYEQMRHHVIWPDRWPDPRTKRSGDENGSD